MFFPELSARLEKLFRADLFADGNNFRQSPKLRQIPRSFYEDESGISLSVLFLKKTLSATIGGSNMSPVPQLIGGLALD